MNRGGFLRKGRFFRPPPVVSERTVGFQIEGTVSLARRSDWAALLQQRAGYGDAAAMDAAPRVFRENVMKVFSFRVKGADFRVKNRTAPGETTPLPPPMQKTL